MRLRVGPFVYEVRWVEGPLEHDGRPCLGLCDNEQHILWVAGVGSHAQQVQVLLHEYCEAWVYQFGEGLADDPEKKERWCDLFGLAMTQFVTDLMATLRLEGWPIPPPEPAASLAESGPSARSPAAIQTKTASAAARTAVYEPPAPPPRTAPRPADDAPTKPAEADVAQWRAHVLDTLRAGFKR
jgi:hypothetical protein